MNTHGQQLSIGQAYRRHSDGATVYNLGNAVLPDGLVWCVDFDRSAGEFYIPLADLVLVPDTGIDTDELIRVASTLARSGHRYFLLWLHQMWAGINQPKSAWYYIAACRAYNGKELSIGHAATFDNLIQSWVCAGTPQPDVDFVNEIYEFSRFTNTNIERCGSWKDAVKRAEVSNHEPSSRESIANAVRLSRCGKFSASQITCSTGVTVITLRAALSGQ